MLTNYYVFAHLHLLLVCYSYCLHISQPFNLRPRDVSIRSSKRLKTVSFYSTIA